MNLYQKNNVYEIINFKSREEWLEKRFKGIGGSDSSSVVGLNPYKTNQDLYKEKKKITISEDISSKPYVKYGTDAEEPLRKLFQLDFDTIYEVQYMENCILKNKQNEFLLFSPDGLLVEKKTGKKGILEIKTTEILQSMLKEKWKNQIPNNYYIQCLHALLVTEFDFVVLKAQLKYRYKEEIYLNTKHYVFEKSDHVEDLKYLLEQEKDFWENHYMKDIEPPLIIKM